MYYMHKFALKKAITIIFNNLHVYYIASVPPMTEGQLTVYVTLIVSVISYFVSIKFIKIIYRSIFF